MPSVLLRAIAQCDGSVVLVAGAGASMEPPTRLRSGGHYAREAHRRLVADGVISPSDCSDPSDLSEVAQVVYDKTGRQLELTSRLPEADWRMAQPNEGHLAAAALLAEGAVRCIVTLNYDLALQHALSQLGLRGVSVVRGPEDPANIGAKSLVFLHRSVELPHETWILTKEALEESWRGAWEEAVAN